MDLSKLDLNKLSGEKVVVQLVAPNGFMACLGEKGEVGLLTEKQQTPEGMKISVPAPMPFMIGVLHVVDGQLWLIHEDPNRNKLASWLSADIVGNITIFLEPAALVEVPTIIGAS